MMSWGREAQLMATGIQEQIEPQPGWRAYLLHMMIGIAAALAAGAWLSLTTTVSRIDEQGTRYGLSRIAVLEAQVQTMAMQQAQILMELRELNARLNQQAIDDAADRRARP